MRVAFHFDADRFGSGYGFPITKLLFREFLECIPQQQRELFIRRGDLPLWDAGDLRAFSERVLLCPRPIWSSVTNATLAAMLTDRRVYVLAVEGLARPDVVAVDSRLQQIDGYFGAIEIHLGNPIHWVNYDRKLIAGYRLFGNELRLLATSAALDPEGRPEGRFKDWSGTSLFSRVEWEDIGLRDTIFDELSNFERAKRIAEIEDRLDSTLGPVVGVVLMRIAALNPLLSDSLHAALHALGHAESEEQLAQACLSCRRFIGQLADALYPSRGTPVNDRKVGPQEYKNRLWAYIEQNFGGDERRHVHSTFQELGDRLDALDLRAQKHIHGSGIGHADVNWLILKLTVWTHDVLTLTPPPTQANVAPHLSAIDKFARALVARHQKKLQ